MFPWPNHRYTFDGAPLRRLAAMTMRGKTKFRDKNIKSDRLTSFGLKNHVAFNKRLHGNMQYIQKQPHLLQFLDFV